MIITNEAKSIINLNAKFLKIIVEAGGCSGLQYIFSYENEATDLIILNEIILTDEVSLPIIKNSILDFKDELGYQEFLISNPNSTSRCGCGNSFNV